MALVRKAVHETATPDPNEVLVSFEDNGIPRNWTLKSAATLRAKLAATPVMIPNPERAPLEVVAFAAAEAEIAEAAAQAAGPST